MMKIFSNLFLKCCYALSLSGEEQNSTSSPMTMTLSKTKIEQR